MPPAQHLRREFVPAVGDHPLGGRGELRFADAKVVDQRGAAIGVAQTVEPLETVVPVAAVLIEQAIDHVLAHHQVGEVNAGWALGQGRCDQVGLLNRAARCAGLDFAQHSVAQPGELNAQIGEHLGRPEDACQRLMAVQQDARLQRIHLVDGLEHAVDASLLDEGRTEVRHQDVAGEQHAVLGQTDQQRVVGLAATRGQQLEARSADRELGRAIDAHVGTVGEHVVELEALAEEAPHDGRITSSVVRELGRVVAAADETHRVRQASEVALAADMVPVRMRHQHGGQWRQ